MSSLPPFEPPEWRRRGGPPWWLVAGTALTLFLAGAGWFSCRPPQPEARSAPSPLVRL
jgi:hypothetical protein